MVRVQVLHERTTKLNFKELINFMHNYKISKM